MRIFYFNLSVSIHAPARGAIVRPVNSVSAVLFQFTHPQGVRWRYSRWCTRARVSIHAPARGAILQDRVAPHCKGFNSRTRKGCDALEFELCFDFQFQFTHPQGVRCAAESFGKRDGVSIHAPARGAMPSTKCPSARNGFNSRTRKGCDNNRACGVANLMFQFTHPQGVR